jgi:hypothetical protein
MENFSQITDTDLFLDLKIVIEPHCGNGPPYGRVNLADRTVFDGPMHQMTTISTHTGLREDIKISIDLSGKIYDEIKETAMHVTSITIDGIEIKDQCHDLIRYVNDQDVQSRTLYLGFNGRWSLEIPGPFYRWWHTKSGQGWLLSGARSRSRGCVPSSASTSDGLRRNADGNTAVANDSTRI